MCLYDLNHDPRARRMYRLANLSLVLGLLPRIFVPQQFLHAHPAADFFSGLFLGCSITLNLWCLRRRRFSRASSGR